MYAIEILWEQRFKVLLLIAIALVWILALEQRKIGALEAQLAAKPLVQDRIVTKTVQGPTHFIERIVTTPGGERIVTREIVRESKTTELEHEHVETPPPAPPAIAAEHYRFAGVTLDPLSPAKIDGIRAGMTVFNRLDLAVSYRFLGRANGPAADVAWRF